MMRLSHNLEAARARAGTLILGLCGALGCSTYDTLKEEPLDCTAAENGYEFLHMSKFDTVGDEVFWTSGDSTPHAVAGQPNTAGTYSAFVRTIPDGPRCDSTAAAYLPASGNKDWGCLFGFNLVGAPRDASAYEGLSFWAMNPGNTTKGLQILLNDPNTAIVTNIGVTSNCIDLGSDTAGKQPIQVYVDGQSVSTSGAVTRPTLPNECGNAYSYTMAVTSDWQLYTIPFGSFQQDAKPNRVPNALLTTVGNVPENGLLTNQILTLIIRMPKEAIEELWIDNLGFYRHAAKASN